MNDLYFDTCSVRDIPACAALAAEAWPHFFPLLAHDDRAQMGIQDLYVRSAFFSSTWHQGIYDKGELMGFLFGRLEKDFTWQSRFRVFWESLRSAYRYMVFLRPHIRTPFLTEHRILAQRIQEHTRDFDGEVLLFIVSKACRGMGIGKKLMENFLQHALERGASGIYLYTDHSSNWKFYERFGFQLQAMIYDDLLSHLEKRKVESFLYSMDLSSWAGLRKDGC